MLPVDRRRRRRPGWGTLAGMDGSEEEYDARWPLVLMVVLTLVGAVLVAAVFLRERSPGAVSGNAGTTSEATAASDVEPIRGKPRQESEAVTVLRSWDRARSQAWASGDLADLRALYVDGSSAGERDAAMLRSWTARGLRVTGLNTQLLAVREVRRTGSSWVVRVTDRVVGGVVVGSRERLPLPVDAASTRVIHWERDQGDWQVASVRDVS